MGGGFNNKTMVERMVKERLLRRGFKPKVTWKAKLGKPAKGVYKRTVKERLRRIRLPQ